jgi:uncharacterized protein YaaR (DUF327 family)
MSRGHKYTVYEYGKKFLAVMILSEHDSMEDALSAMLDAMRAEGDEITKGYIEEQRANGINVVTLEEAVKDMTPEGLVKFMEERQKKFINPLLDANIKTLESKGRRLKIKRIK